MNIFGQLNDTENIFFLQNLMPNSSIVFCLLNTLTSLPIIVGGCYFLYAQTTSCLHRTNNIDLNLYSWLTTYAYMQISFVFFSIFALIYQWTIRETVNCLTAISFILLFFNSLFQLCWIILGSVIFWGEMKGKGCDNYGIYMNIILSIQYFLIGLNLTISIKQYIEDLNKQKEQSLAKIEEENPSNIEFLKETSK